MLHIAGFRNFSKVELTTIVKNLSRKTLTRKQNLVQHVQGGPKKVSHYRQSSLNRIKKRQPG